MVGIGKLLLQLILFFFPYSNYANSLLFSLPLSHIYVQLVPCSLQYINLSSSIVK